MFYGFTVRYCYERLSSRKILRYTVYISNDSSLDVFGLTFQVCIRCIGIIVLVILTSNSVMMIPGVCLILIAYQLQRMHVCTARSLHRLDSEGKGCVPAVLSIRSIWSANLSIGIYSEESGIIISKLFHARNNHD